MKLYQYDDLKKVNQALGSFKRNKVPVSDVKILTVDGKVQYFIVADPVYTPKPEEDKPKKEETKPVDKKEEVVAEEKEETPKEEKEKK
jgi:hypothetical protein